VLAAVAYLPLLANDMGRVAADTKAYLYLDPGRLLAGAPYMWQPEVAMGTVTHQNIGYLWPVGPFFWLGEAIGLPDWITQRLWLGSVLLAAGLGMRWFLRTLGWRGAALLVSSLSYMLSPYLLNYVDRHSVILLPWAGLPWLMGLTVRALRTPGWRHAAIFGLVTLTVGGVNASSLLLVGIGPVAWLAWCAVEGSAPWRRVVGTAARIGLAFAATGIWWMVGLAIQSRYGLPTLHLTENYKVVSDAATAPELFRGLGYWYFYGQGRLGAWIEPATSYTRWALPLSFALPLLALLAAAIIRFRHRGHALMLIVLGLLVGIGAHPYDGPSPLGRIFRDLTLTDAGLALRSTPRALPLSILGTSMLLGAGAAAMGRWRPRWEQPVAALLCVLVVANLSPLWQGEILGSLVQRPEDVPGYWHEAAAHLDASGDGTRVLELPGSDFAAYRWGNSGDPVLPGLMDRPYVARELIPQGSPASAALLVALDSEVQEGRLDPDGLAPLARLMGVGDIVLRSDLQFERFRTPRPDDLWADLRDAPGFGPAVSFGTPVANVAGPERPLLDQHTLSRPVGSQHPAPAIVLPVLDAQSILRIADPTRSIVLSGDADGLVAAAGEGLLEAGRPVLFSASLLDPVLLASALGSNARLILTDTNRLQGRRWGTIRETTGYTQRWDEEVDRGDLSDQRLDVLPVRPGTLTVARQTGIRVDASGYGNPVTFTAGDRPFHAVDGRLDTAWTVGAFDEVVGEHLTLTLDEPAPIESLTFVQARSQGQNRWITDLRIHLDDQVMDVVLDATSRTPPGQLVHLSGADVRVVVLEVRDTDVGRLDHYAGVTGVGFAEVGVAGVAADETILLPTDLTDLLGYDSGAELAIVLTRQRSDPRDPIRSEPERGMDRTMDLPWARTFELRGEARWSAHADDALLDDPGAPRVRATASLAGDLVSRGRAAFDDDPTTAWQPPIGPQDGQAVTITHPVPRAFRDLTLTYRADGLHSAPSAVTVLVDGVPIGRSTLPGTLRAADDLVTVDLGLPDATGRSLTMRIDEVVERRTMNWYSGLPDVLPVAIVDISDGFDFPERPQRIDTGCREDLLRLDGRSVPVRITGSTPDAFARRPLAVTACGPTLELSEGEHRIVATAGADSMYDLDRLVLTSASSVIAPTHAGMPSLRVQKLDRTEILLQVEGATSPYWLILGQSLSAGWQLRDDAGLDHGPPRLVDGFANGWLVAPDDAARTSFRLVWAPQRTVWIGLWASVMAALACLLVAIRGRRDSGPLAPGSPVFEDPRRSRRVVPDGRAVALGLFVATFSVVNLPSWHIAGPVIGLLMTLALRGSIPRRTMPVLAVLAMGSAAALIAIEQIRFRHPRDFVWPLFFEGYHVLGVLAILCLAAGAVQALVERRAA
jgi:arabinofuranan 3-O-arabinosyltransferase